MHCVHPEIHKSNKYDSIGELSFNRNISKCSSTPCYSQNWSSELHSPQCHIEYVANIQGPLRLSPFRSQAFRPEGNSFLSGELRYIDGSACDKGTPGTPPPLKQAAIPLASTYSSSSLSPPGSHSAAVFNQHSIRSQTLSAKNPSTTSHIISQHSFLGNMKED